MPDSENNKQKKTSEEDSRLDKKPEPEVGSGVRSLVSEKDERVTDDRDQGGSSGQKGQPGIPDPDKDVWSPGTPEIKP